MNPTTGLLLEVWREVGRHFELHESIPTIAAMLAKHLPLGGLLIERLDAPHQSIETVAAWNVSQLPISNRRATPAGKFKRLQAWANSGDLLADSPGTRASELAALVPAEVSGEILAGPLRGSHGGSGAVIFVANPSRPFQPADRQLASALQEPFSAALENHHRLHELATLREAAEADRRSLLSRLGKQEMGEAIVGADGGLKMVMERVELVAKSDVPVLILGETGTGKEVVSRAIHTRSPRSAAPFIRVNCGAIPAELIDSQLFGHEKGSFTGAAETRQGWFERTDGGTLFLDEIGELPLAAQVRLLRVLQDGFIERVGGREPLRVDVRMIAATHRDLASMVKATTFREDLWYRVNVFPILLPRLRERKSDIAALASHFAHRAANRFGLSHVEPSPADLHLLMRYHWPGNIRELSAVIDRAAILGNGQRLDIPAALGGDSNSIDTVVSVSSSEPTLYEVIPEVTQPLVRAPKTVGTLDEAMKDHIQLALIATRGRIEGANGAAQLLDINPHTLRARMRKLGLDWSQFRD